MIERLIQFALENRLLVTVLLLAVAGAGIYSYRKLPVDAFPDVSPNLVQVFTPTEGLAPEEVEKFVTYPIEAAMAGLPGVEKIRSVSNFGLSVVNVYFRDDMDIYLARQLVSERLQEAREQIPPGFGTPRLGPISTALGLVLFYDLEDSTGRYSLEELRTIQDWIVKYQLRTVPGVTEVLSIGGFVKQFQVIVSPEALLRYDLTLAEIVRRLKANNFNIGAQYIVQNGEQLIVRSVGLARGIEDLGNIVVKTVDGRPVYLRQVAKIQIGGAIRYGLQTKDGQGEVVAGMVIKLYGTNASTVIQRVEEKIEEINRALPPGLKIKPYYQQRELVEAAVWTVTEALVQGILLVVLVLFGFMGAFRPSLVVAVAIPFSVLFAFVAMEWLGISANLMSFGGLAIAIGMMVDGAIVMVENADRHLQTAPPGASRLQVILRACLEVGRPIVFAIAIVILVFLPLWTLQGVEGKTFRPLAYTVALGMAGSLLYALLGAPSLASLLLKGGPGREIGFVETLIARYRPVVGWFVARPRAALLLALLLFLLGALALPFLGAEFTPRLREGTIVVRLTMAPSIALEESKRLTFIVERRLLEIPEVVGVTSRIGRGEVGAHTDPVNSAEMYVLLKPKEQWRRPGDQAFIEEEIREKLQGLPGILVNLTQPIEMSVEELLEGVRAELALKLFGEDLEVLRRKANEIAAVLRRVPGAADVQVAQISGTPFLLIRPDREQIARYGLNLEDVQNTIRIAVGGVVAGQVFEGIRRFDIYVRYPEAARATPEAIAELLIPGPGGIRVPLVQVAEIKRIVGPREITREDFQRFIVIQANVVGRDIGSFVAEAQRRIEEEVKIPPGYFLRWGGQFRLQQEAFRRLAIVVPLTLLGIVLLLYSSFRRGRSTALILFNIPLALTGGVLALWLSGQHLSVPASVGFIALFGIALGNGMVLIAYLDQLVERGIPPREAAVQGACRRLRPVLMTATTTALGLIPLLLATGTGSEVQRPLATVVVGGLFSSTLLTLLVLPALYGWLGGPRREGSGRDGVGNRFSPDGDGRETGEQDRGLE